jgi:hypothetical protein
MYLLADKILNPDGTVKYGKKKVIKEWEQKWGVKFMENGFEDLHRHGILICAIREIYSTKFLWAYTGSIL